MTGWGDYEKKRDWDKEIQTCRSLIEGQEKHVEETKKAYNAFTEPQELWEYHHTKHIAASRALDKKKAELEYLKACKAHEIASLDLKMYRATT